MTDKHPPTTAPTDLSASARGYARKEDAQQVGQVVLEAIRQLSRYIDLETLDGVTLAYDYTEALRELDRGTETTTDLEASQDWGQGVAMTPAVLRDGALKSHMLFNAGVLEGFVADPESDAWQESFHILAHECAHVEINAIQDRQFPGMILRHRVEGLYNTLRQEVIEASWSEYAACRISAPIGASPLANYQEVFLVVIAEAWPNVREAILRYRHDADLDQLLIEAQRNIGSIVKYASYLIGTLDGLDMSVEDDRLDLRDALEGHWVAPFFFRLREAHRALWERYGAWETPDEFNVIADIWLEMMADRGLELTPMEDADMYVNVPFHRETNEYQATLWGLRQADGQS